MFPQLREHFAFCVALARRQEVGDRVGAFPQVSGIVSWRVTKLVTVRPDIARCPGVGAPVTITKYGQDPAEAA